MIHLEQLTFGYGRKVLFDRLDATLEPGGLYGLLGLNGAGKTSFLKLLAGGLFPQGGRLEAWGREPRFRSPQHLADTVFVPEDPAVASLTVQAWVNRVRPFRPAFEPETFAELSDLLEVVPSAKLDKLSYGQRKKAVLAVALASGARTLLLDEPTNGLDIPSKVRFRQALARAARPDRVVVVSTHQVRDLESLLDPVLIMDRGRIPFTLDPQDLPQKLSTRRVSNLAGLPVVHAVRDTLGWAAVLAESSDAEAPDLELVFSAAITRPTRLAAALAGEALTPYDEGALE